MTSTFRSLNLVFNTNEERLGKLINDPRPMIGLLRCRRARHPAVRCGLLHVPPRPLGPRTQRDHAGVRRQTNHLGAGRLLWFAGSRATEHRQSRRCRDLRCQNRRLSAARHAERRSARWWQTPGDAGHRSDSHRRQWCAGLPGRALHRSDTGPGLTLLVNKRDARI